MRTCSRNLSLLAIVIAGLGMSLAGRGMAQTFRNLYSFSVRSGTLGTNSDGADPSAALIISGNTLYGTTVIGGHAGNGTGFAIKTDGTGFTNLHSFSALAGGQNTNGDGATPFGEFVLLGNTLFGTTSRGGKEGSGTVFAVNTDGSGFRILHHFTMVGTIYPSAGTNADGANPSGGLVLLGNTLYGTAQYGGESGNGVVFALSTDGTRFTNLYTFTKTYYDSAIGAALNSDGARPAGGLVLSSNLLYGTTPSGGTSANGTVFCVHTDGTGFVKLHDFEGFTNRFRTNGDGANPVGSLVLSGKTLYGNARSGGDFGQGAVFRVDIDGTAFTNLHSFYGISVDGFFAVASGDGDAPIGGLVLLSNILYGATSQGGTTNSGIFPNGYGIVFAVNTDGTGFIPLYRFSAVSNTNYSNPDGANPSAGLVLGSNTLYGTAGGGGTSGDGTIFGVPTISRILPPPPPQFGAIYADFTTVTIQTGNMTIAPGPYFTYNTNYGGNWDIAAVSFGFTGTFDVPATGTYRLTVNHQSSAAASCPGGGYSPVNIYINGTQIASNFDPAQQSGGSRAEVTNSWLITATAGVDNTLKWSAGPLCSRYWIEGIQITPMPSPVLSLSLAPSNAVLSWDTNLTGFVLESTAALGGAWSRVSLTPVVVGTTNFATNTISAPSQFYRLRDSSGP
jgi:uncharacterized repeat protein (TIGR03803 family)